MALLLEKDKDIIIVITDDKPVVEDRFEAVVPAENIVLEEDIVTDISAETTDNKKHARKKPIKKPLIIIKEKIAGLYGRGREYFNALPRDLDKRFVKLTLAAGLAIIIAAACTAYFVPKSENAVSKGLEHLMQKDSAYLEAQSAYDAAAAERDNLKSELELKKQALEEFHGAQSSLDKINKLNDELKKTRDRLKNDVSAKQAELDSLAGEQEKAANKITTLSSGQYTVGEDIAEGVYTITGTGSIAIANSGRSTANKLLKADGESFTLKQGDRVQIEGSAKLIPQ